MRKRFTLLLFIFALGTLFACAKEEEPVTEALPPEPLMVELTVTNEVEVGETVDMSSLVTMGDQKIDDADEVVYEIWEEGKKSESTMMDSVNEGDGIYTAETSFDHDGQFHIQVHVTAEGQHTMPVETVTVGHGGEYEESEGHDYHTKGFSMHFMEPSDVNADDEETLTVHIELDEAPLKQARVRYEIWHEGGENAKDWINATEESAGVYSAPYTFEEAETYTIVIHVEDDADLHEHAEHEVEVQ